MDIGLLQANLNHVRLAQDMFLHTMAKRGLGLGIAAESYKIPPNHPCWAGDKIGSVAIHWQTLPGSPLCIPLSRGEVSWR